MREAPTLLTPADGGSRAPGTLGPLAVAGDAGQWAALPAPRGAQLFTECRFSGSLLAPHGTLPGLPAGSVPSRPLSLTSESRRGVICANPAGKRSDRTWGGKRGNRPNGSRRDRRAEWPGQDGMDEGRAPPRRAGTGWQGREESRRRQGLLRTLPSGSLRPRREA